MFNGALHWWSWVAFNLFCKSALRAQEWIQDYQDIKIFFFIYSKPLIPLQGFLKIQLCYWHSPSPFSYRSACTTVLKLLAIYLLGLLRTQLYRLKSDTYQPYNQPYWISSHVLLLCRSHACNNLLQETGRGILFLYPCKVSWGGCNFYEFCLNEVTSLFFV